MSNGFASSSTRDLDGITREVESRLSRDNVTMAKWGHVETHSRDKEFHNIAVLKNKADSKVVGSHPTLRQAISQAHQVASMPATQVFGSVPPEFKSMKHLDVFTDDFSPPGASELAPGQDPNKANGGYQKPHDDFVPEASRKFTLAAAGDAKDQEPLDRIDREQQQIESGIKPQSTQFPGAKRMSEEKKIDGPEAFSSEVEKRLTEDKSQLWHDLCSKLCGPTAEVKSTPPNYFCLTESESDSKSLADAIKAGKDFKHAGNERKPGGILVKARA